MSLRHFLLLTLASVCLSGRVGAQTAFQDASKPQIEQVLTEQANAWNRGDIDGFMEGYAKISTLRFASGANVTYG